MTLQDEIEAGRSTVKADAYAMSIGEIVNLYRDRELVIRPEFQRLFRWTPPKKSRLIESILLGIPPSFDLRNAAARRSLGSDRWASKAVNDSGVHG
ncbi:hypothetical protein [Streptomyces sp. NPDC047829]|uniref:hypothetical protein n=1 Tax=Streptomyces sp. NPDC047829 TaxID=3154609 RepID=UPI0033D2945F